MRLLKGNMDVVAPISAPMLQIVPMPAPPSGVLNQHKNGKACLIPRPQTQPTHLADIQ